jgi:porin
VRTHLFLVLVLSGLSAAGQTGGMGAVVAPPSNPPGQTGLSTRLKHTDELKQELEVNAAILSRIPADPLIRPDPLGPIFRPVDNLSERFDQTSRLKFGATYTFLNQYATVVPDGVRHNQFSGRLDFTGAWGVYQHASTAGSISLLIRSGSNIGISQQFNLSDRIGSGLYLNCLQGGGPQELITVNIRYWRQDFLDRRLSTTAAIQIG